MKYDPETCITAGELRAIGAEIDANIPDVAWVSRSALQTQTVPAKRQDRTVQEVRILVAQPFQWLEVDYILEEAPAPGEIYQHFKGGVYVILDTGTHTETQEEMVLYRSMEGGRIWIRPLNMFLDSVEIEEGVKTPRFAKIIEREK